MKVSNFTNAVQPTCALLGRTQGQLLLKPRCPLPQSGERNTLNVPRNSPKHTSIFNAPPHINNQKNSFFIDFI